MTTFRVHATVDSEPVTLDVDAKNPEAARTAATSKLRKNDKTVVRIKKTKVIR